MAGGYGRGVDHPLPATPAARRHCWVVGPPDSPGPHPGLVVAWDKREGEWFAQVVYVIEADGALVAQWLPAALLRPAR